MNFFRIIVALTAVSALEEKEIVNDETKSFSNDEVTINSIPPDSFENLVDQSFKPEVKVHDLKSLYGIFTHPPRVQQAGDKIPEINYEEEGFLARFLPPLDKILWVPSYGIIDSYKNPILNVIYYQWMTFASGVYAGSFLPGLSGWVQLFSGVYGRYGLPYGFIGQLIWLNYSSTVLPSKVPVRNTRYMSAYIDSSIMTTYLFMLLTPYALYCKLNTPEVFEFDFKEIKERGYGLTMGEAMGIRYFGEENGTKDKQDTIWMLIGFILNYYTLQFLVYQSPTFIKDVLDQIWSIFLEALGPLAFIIVLIGWPFLFLYALIEAAYMFALLFYVLFVVLPSSILMLIFGINQDREEDLVTWILQLKELNIYDGMKHPYTNQFEIPEGREYHARNIDSGFVSAYGLNPDLRE